MTERVARRAATISRTRSVGSTWGDLAKDRWTWCYASVPERQSSAAFAEHSTPPCRFGARSLLTRILTNRDALSGVSRRIGGTVLRCAVG